MLYWEWYPYNEYEELMEAGLIPDESDEEEFEEDFAQNQYIVSIFLETYSPVFILEM